MRKIVHFDLFLPPFSFKVSSDIEIVKDNIKLIYPASCFKSGIPADYTCRISQGAGVRRIIKPQARFFMDQQEPFKPLQRQQAFAMFEWGLNWCIASHEMQYVIIHAAVLAKDNKAILFPAPPGSGKSTLTAYLAFNGWRLLSDEMAFIVPSTSTVVPFVRPICLKNRSIELAKSWFPNAIFSSIAKDTHKGNVMHLSPPSASWLTASEPAEIVGVVFPRFCADIQLDIYKLNKAQGFMQLATNAFNYGVIGTEGFNTLTALIEKVPSFEILYNDLHEVSAFLNNCAK